MHNAGKQKWTARFKPWKLEWQSDLLGYNKAIKLEKKIKGMKAGPGVLAIMAEQGDYML